MYTFLEDHPLYKTHKVKFDKQKKNTVPNFVGGSLPRCDQGDREYYCATMLTLFKSWRSGKFFKNENQSFDEALIHSNLQFNKINTSKFLIFDMNAMMLEMIFLPNL